MNPIHHVTGNHVLIAPEPEKNVTPSGIILKEKPYWQDAGRVWFVVATGWGKVVKSKRTKQKRIEPMPVRPGDRVLVDFTLGHQFDFPTGERIVDAGQIILCLDSKCRGGHNMSQPRRRRVFALP